MKPTPLRPRELLLVADAPADAALVQKNLTSPTCRLTPAIGTDDALALLNGGARPDLVLLIPGSNADGTLPVLTALKSDSQRKLIPIVVVLADCVAADVVQAYQRQANCCLRRPTDAEEFVRLLGEIEGFWLKLALLPPTD